MSQKNILVEPETQDEASRPEAETGVVERSAAPQTETEISYEIPEKFRNKEVSDVVQMYTNLEKELGRQANEIGTYRELVATLSEVKRASDLSEGTKQEASTEVTSDQLFDNPTETISNIVRATLEKELRPLKQQSEYLTRESAVEALQREHPDMEQIGGDPQFLEFVQRNPYRVQDAQKWMETRDVNAARRLLTDYKDMVGHKVTQSSESPAASRRESPVERARKVATESSGSGGSSNSKKVFYKDEVIRMITTDPERYRSDSFQSELKSAISEGRFRS